eukprot:1198990-Amphidinium_carterae.1
MARDTQNDEANTRFNKKTSKYKNGRSIRQVSLFLGRQQTRANFKSTGTSELAKMHLKGPSVREQQLELWALEHASHSGASAPAKTRRVHMRGTFSILITLIAPTN